MSEKVVEKYRVKIGDSYIGVDATMEEGGASCKIGLFNMCFSVCPYPAPPLTGRELHDEIHRRTKVMIRAYFDFNSKKKKKKKKE
jgi:hypothetical protein